MQTDDLILCQPDHIKSCSACCGLFNFRDISKKFLETLLECNTLSQTHGFKAINEIETTFLQRDLTSYICPYQGYLSNGKPGCLLHPMHLTADLRDNSLYGARICESYFCPAHSILENFYKQILITSVHDWYLYSIAILDPFSSIWIIDYINSSLGVNHDKHMFDVMFNSALTIHSNIMCGYEFPLFHYSEYDYKNSPLAEMSLSMDNDHSHAERIIISKCLATFIDNRVV